MLRILAQRPLALLACLSLLTPAALAEIDESVALASHCGSAAGCGDACCEDGCCGSDGCGNCCVGTPEVKKVEKHCWKEECKQICVPKVICPWKEGGSGLTLFSWMKKHRSSDCGDACYGDTCCDSSCGDGVCCGLKPRCGEVKWVRDIKKEKYECDKCVYKWDIRRLPPCCGSDGCCGSGGHCGDACCDPGCGCPTDCGAQAAPAPRASSGLRQPELQLASAVEEVVEAESEREEGETTPWYRRAFSR